AATINRSARILNARIDLDMFFDFLMRDQHVHKDVQLRCSSRANSDDKTHYGLVASRSEERGAECKQDWNTEEGCLPSLNEQISATSPPAVGKLMDESPWLGLLMVAEAEIRRK